MTTTTRGGCGPRSWPRSPAARRCRRPVRCTPQRACRPATHPDFIAEFAAALQELAQPIRLILDDVQELVDPQALEGLRTFIRVKPATVQLVLASRLDPPLSLPRLRLAGRLWELRAAQLSFTPTQAAALLENSGLRLSPHQVEVLHRRTGGWAAGLRLAALGMGSPPTTRRSSPSSPVMTARWPTTWSARSSCGLPADLQDFLRVTSICDPMPVALAAELSGRDDAGSVLDRLEHRDLAGHRDGAARARPTASRSCCAPIWSPTCSATACDGWPGCTPCPPAGGPPRTSRYPPLSTPRTAATNALLTELLHRFAIRLILAGDHGPLRRALAGVGAQAAAADPWLCLASALTHLAAGELAAAQGDLRHAQQVWPAHGGADLAVLRAVAEQFGGRPDRPAPLRHRRTPTSCPPNRSWRRSPT